LTSSFKGDYMFYYLIFFISLLLIGISEFYFKYTIQNYLKNGNTQQIRLAKLFYNYNTLIVFSLLFIVGAIRYNVGVDYTTYSNLQIPKVLEGDFFYVEPLASLVFIIGNFLGSYQWIFAILHLILMVFIYFAIKENKTYVTLSYFIFFFSAYFNSSLNLMRQSISIAIFIYAIKYIWKRKMVKYFIYIMIAVLFHKTAILYFPVYFIFGLKVNKKNTALFTSLILIMSISLDRILKFFTTFFDIYTNYWGTTEMAMRQVNYSLTYWFLNLIILSFMLIFKFIKKDKGNTEDKRIDLYIYIQLMSVVIMIFSLFTYVPNFDRLLTMFSYAQIITVPYFFSLKIKNSIKLPMLIFILLVYLVAFYQLIIDKNIGNTLPYLTIFSN